MDRMWCTSSLILGVACSGGGALAQQWAVVRLHPEGAQVSEVTSVTATRQGGWMRPLNGQPSRVPGLWSGSAGSWAPLSAPGVGGSLLGMDETSEAGSLINVGGVSVRAVLWRGTPESMIDLHPPGAVTSGAAAVCGNVQAGGFNAASSPIRAALWSGTPESLVDLHPPTSVGGSAALATDGMLQGGWGEWLRDQWLIPQATIWHGTAGGYVNLSPGGATSFVRGMAPGVQVGRALLPGATSAALWHGTPESFVNLNPPGWSTLLYATTGRIHVGDGGEHGFARALINFGTRDSWLDLHQFLPPQYTSFSSALAVYQDGDTIYVGGWAENSGTTYREAILWIGTVACYANCDDSTTPPILNVDDFTCFIDRFATGDGYANCDRSTTAPVLNVDDFICFINAFAQGCP